MSMLWAWDRVMGDHDRIEVAIREEEQERQPRREVDGAPLALTCRVCEYEGLEEYCPRCLADTMRRAPLRR